jgi:hypothetical protein
MRGERATERVDAQALRGMVDKCCMRVRPHPEKGPFRPPEAAVSSSPLAGLAVGGTSLLRALLGYATGARLSGAQKGLRAASPELTAGLGA